MKGERHPIDELLRSAAGEPRPTEDDVLTGRRMLLAAMRAEEQRTAARAPRAARPRLRLAVGSALLIVAAVAVGATVLSPTPVTALGDLAVVAERTPALSFSDGEQVYTKVATTTARYATHDQLGLPTTGTVAYLLPTVRERWEGSGGYTERLTVGPPTFFSPDDEAAYYAAGLDEVDAVGPPVTESFLTTPGLLEERAWSTDPGEVLGQMQATASNQAGDRPADVATVEVGLRLLADPMAEPALRAAVLTALDDLDLGQVIYADDGGVTLRVDYLDGGRRHRLEAEFDADATLVRQTTIDLDGDAAVGIPAGTAIDRYELLESAIVSEVGESG